MNYSFYILLAVMTPLTGAILCLFRSLTPYILPVSPFMAVPAFFLALSGFSSTLALPAMIGGGSLGLDYTGSQILSACALLWGLSAWHATGYLGKHPRAGVFFVGFLFSMAGNFLLILSMDAICFYTGFALMTFASIILVLHPGDAYARRASLVYLVLSLMGEALLFPGLMMAIHGAGSTELSQIRHFLNGSISIPLILIFIGFSVKAGAVPLHVWLPLAHSAAPAPASAVLSGCMIKAGLLGWLRILPLSSETMVPLIPFLLITGLTGWAGGAIAASLQSHPKVLLAYSSVSKMGLAICILAIGLQPAVPSTVTTGALLALVVFHALNKGALFLGTSVTPGRIFFLDHTMFIILLMSFAGVPLLPGGNVKILAKAVLASAPGGWAIIFTILGFIAAVFTGLALIRFYRLTGPGAGDPVPLSKSSLYAWRGAGISVILLALYQGGNVLNSLSFYSVVKSLVPLGIALFIAWVVKRKNWSIPKLPAGDLINLLPPFPHITFEDKGRPRSVTRAVIRSLRLAAIAEWVEKSEQRIIREGWGDAALLMVLMLLIIIMSLIYISN
jgi:hydrogenase-4 component B